MTVRAIKSSAHDFLTKPIREDVLLGAILAAIRRFQSSECPLNPRERAVLGLVGRGQSNKWIARDLKIAPDTVKSDVKHIFVKLGTRTRAESIKQAAKLGLV